MTKEETWNRLVGLGIVQGKMPSRRLNLREACLEEADLSEANLIGANLFNANLAGANLSEADLTEADLSYANFIYADFAGTDLSYANLAETDLSYANLTGADLSYANLTGADLTGADLGAANLTNAILTNAIFVKADLNEANLAGADLNNANLFKADLSYANLAGADLNNANLNEANLSGADLNNANLFKADLTEASFNSANLLGTNLKESTISDVRFSLADLSGADITGCTFWGVSTTGWKIDGIKAQYVYLCRANELDKDKFRRSFQEGQFEAFYKFLPTVELIFDGGLGPGDILILNSIIEGIREQNPDSGVKMAQVSVDEHQTRVGIKTKKDKFLEPLTKLIQKGLEDASKRGISFEAFTQQIKKMHPDPNIIDIPLAQAEQQPSTVHIQDLHFSINIINAGGSRFEAPITQAGKLGSPSNVIILNYQNKREDLDRLFGELKESFSECETLMRDKLDETTDRLIEAIREGNENRFQNCWEQIKEGIKTGGAAATILTSIARLLGIA